MYMDNHSMAAPVCRATRKDRQRQPAEQVRVEISADKLRELMQMGALCANDVNCLDCASKRCVWRICLRACLRHFSSNSNPPSPRRRQATT